MSKVRAGATRTGPPNGGQGTESGIEPDEPASRTRCGCPAGSGRMLCCSDWLDPSCLTLSHAPSRLAGRQPDVDPILGDGQRRDSVSSRGLISFGLPIEPLTASLPGGASERLTLTLPCRYRARLRNLGPVSCDDEGFMLPRLRGAPHPGARYLCPPRHPVLAKRPGRCLRT
jgi:hypothetical protein